ncbi:MAG TPA: hypothetical protein VEL76_24210 [Gemmataceae bacterium]|nr:hypothetical protein [Gemmataceae bacterium]
MRVLSASLLCLAVLAGASAQTAGKGKPVVNFNVEADFDKYPQKTPQEALNSVVKALTDRRVDYLLAHLADPAFVQAKLKILKAQMSASLTDDTKATLAFQRLVKATDEHFRDDPTKVRELGRFAKDGEWATAESGAAASLKLLPARKVFLKKVQDRWYLEDRDK